MKKGAVLLLAVLAVLAGTACGADLRKEILEIPSLAFYADIDQVDWESREWSNQAPNGDLKAELVGSPVPVNAEVFGESESVLSFGETDFLRFPADFMKGWEAMTVVHMSRYAPGSVARRRIYQGQSQNWVVGFEGGVYMDYLGKHSHEYIERAGDRWTAVAHVLRPNGQFISYRDGMETGSAEGASMPNGLATGGDGQTEAFTEWEGAALLVFRAALGDSDLDLVHQFLERRFRILAGGFHCGPAGYNVRTTPRLPDDRITVSSRDAEMCAHGALHGPTAWCPERDLDGEWVQLDLGEELYVEGVYMQGHESLDQYVTQFRVSVATKPDGPWITSPTLSGPQSAKQVVRRRLPAPQVARFVRLYPIKWHARAAVRFDVAACEPCAHNGGCLEPTTCQVDLEVPGGRVCSDCPDGYGGDGLSGCVDIDECASNSHVCGEHGICKNTAGSYECHCPKGYEKDEMTNLCAPIDHCLEDNGGCHELARCSSTPEHGASCACPEGYSGDGKSSCKPPPPVVDPARFVVTEKQFAQLEEKVGQRQKAFADTAAGLDKRMDALEAVVELFEKSAEEMTVTDKARVRTMKAHLITEAFTDLLGRVNGLEEAFGLSPTDNDGSLISLESVVDTLQHA